MWGVRLNTLFAVAAGQQQANSRPTAGQQQANSRPTAGQQCVWSLSVCSDVCNECVFIRVLCGKLCSHMYCMFKAPQLLISGFLPAAGHAG
jgi:hypothetical protein